MDVQVQVFPSQNNLVLAIFTISIEKVWEFDNAQVFKLNIFQQIARSQDFQTDLFNLSFPIANNNPNSDGFVL